MKNFLHLAYRVFSMFILGNSIFLMPLFLISFIFSMDIEAKLFHGNGVIALLFFGVIGVAWGIREGEFISDVKESHWTNQNRRN